MTKPVSQPCPECPFRRKAPAGYIGAHDAVEEITDIVLSDGRFPCHMEVTKRTERGEKFDRAVWTAPVCVGSAALLCNMIKRSRLRDVSAVQDTVGKRDDVFARPEEMHSHHNSFLQRIKARQKGG